MNAEGSTTPHPAPTLEGARSPTPPLGIAGDPRLEAVWSAIVDPVGAERPGEAQARVARLVAAQREEARRRERFGSLYPVPLRLAAAAAPLLGLVLGLAITPAPLRLAATEPPPVTIAPAPSAAPSSSDREETPRVEATRAERETAATEPEPEPEPDLAPEWEGFAAPLLAELYLEDVGFSNGADPLENESQIEELR
jgi:hypothetical protein